MEQSFFETTEAGRTALQPSLVTAKHFDFFKAEPVTIFNPAILNDGLLQKQTAEISTAFLFPSEEDCTIWGRYGSATKDQGANRQACSTPIKKKALRESLAQAGKSNCISHGEFLLVIEPSFTSINDEEDMVAVVARTHTVVCPEPTHVVLWHTAAEEAKLMSFRYWPKGLKPARFNMECKPVFKAYKDNPNARVYSDDFQWKRDWSQVFLCSCIYGGPLPPILTISGPTMFDPRPSTIYKYPSLQQLEDFGQASGPAVIKKKLQNYPGLLL